MVTRAEIERLIETLRSEVRVFREDSKELVAQISTRSERVGQISIALDGSIEEKSEAGAISTALDIMNYAQEIHDKAGEIVTNMKAVQDNKAHIEEWKEELKKHEEAN